MRLFWNDQGIAQSTFKISAPPEIVVPDASHTALPEGTVTVPYLFQLTARGGTPPYKWTATKGFPNGLTLSGTGTLSGTPLRRGGSEP